MPAYALAPKPSPHIARLVDPRSASWRLPMVDAMRWKQKHLEARDALLHAIGADTLPTWMAHLLFSRWTLKHSGRLKMLTFLWGNGVGRDMCLLILAPLVKPKRDFDCKQILDSLQSRKYDATWYYYSCMWRIHLYLDGRVKEELNDYTRLQIANYHWQQHIDRHGYQTLKQQTEFFLDFGVDA